jgi:hypothetical protein
VLTISTTRLPADGAIALKGTIVYFPVTATEFCKMVGPSNVAINVCAILCKV